MFTCGTQTSSLLFRFNAAFSPSTGSNDPFLSIPFMERSISPFATAPAPAFGATAEKAAADAAQRVNKRALVFIIAVVSALSKKRSARITRRCFVLLTLTLLIGRENNGQERDYVRTGGENDSKTSTLLTPDVTDPKLTPGGQSRPKSRTRMHFSLE